MITYLYYLLSLLFVKVRGDVRRRKEIILRLVSSKPRSWRELREATGFTEPTLWRHLNELKRAGAVERLPDGRWVIGKRYPLLFLKDKVDEALMEWKPVSVQNYATLLNGLKEDELLDHFRRDYFWRAVRSFLSNVYRDYANHVLEALDEESRRKVVESILKLTYFGYLLHENRKKLRLGAIYRTLAEKEGEKDIEDYEPDDFSDFFFEAWNYAIEREDWLVHNLWSCGAIKEIIDLALLETDGKWIRRSLEDLRAEARELANTLRQALFEKLADLRLALIIYVDRSIHAKPLSFVYVFEEWLQALRDGSLDHRSHIFDRAPVLLTKFKRYVERKRSGAGLSLEEEREFESLLLEKIDWDEAWTLGDLYQYHPRGKSASLYEEILEEIELRRPHLELRDREKSILDTSSEIRSKLRPEALERIRRALGCQRPTGKFLKYSDLRKR